MPAVLSTIAYEQLIGQTKEASENGVCEGKGEEKGEEKKKVAGSAEANHDPVLLALLCKELGCSKDDIEDFELQLCDTQPR